MGSLPLNAIVLVLLVETVNPHFDVLFSNLYIDFCSRVSDSTNIT
jgi:hypothetical protein